jgi:hypothetical protein
MTHHLGQRAVPAPYALPAGFAMFLAVGTAAAALHGRLTATGVLAGCAAVAFAASFATGPGAAVLLAGIGWLTVTGFSRPPYAQLRPTGPVAAHAAVVLGVSALVLAATHPGKHGHLYGYASPSDRSHWRPAGRYCACH